MSSTNADQQTKTTPKEPAVEKGPTEVPQESKQSVPEPVPKEVPEPVPQAVP